jgi:ribosome maturation factor RimP
MTSTKQVDLDEIASIATPVIEGAGYELVDVEWKRDLGGWVLRVYIDKPGGPHAPGQGISLDGCAAVSHELSTVLDVSDAVPGPEHYALEVSSPGLDRPLRREQDFVRAVGHKVKIKTRRPLGPPPGRRNFAGPLLAVSTAEGTSTLQIDVGDRTWDVPIGEVDRANLVFELTKHDGSH